MMKALLVRTDSSPDGTFGILYLENKKFYTLELPDRNNEKNHSCIPLGTYECTYVFSPKFNKKTYLLSNVKDRSGIRIHSANFSKELEGCIALGKSRGILNGVPAVISSKNAISEFEEFLKGQPFTLEIMEGRQDGEVYIA